MPDSLSDIEDLLIRVATTGMDDRPAADVMLWDWIGREKTPAANARLQQLAHVTPRLVAEACARGGWAEPGDYGPTRDDLAPYDQAAARAIARYLSNQPDIGAAIIEAYIANFGPKGAWEVGAAALRLLAAELNDQRNDAGGGPQQTRTTRRR